MSCHGVHFPWHSVRSEKLEDGLITTWNEHASDLRETETIDRSSYLVFDESSFILVEPRYAHTKWYDASSWVKV